MPPLTSDLLVRTEQDNVVVSSLVQTELHRLDPNGDEPVAHHRRSIPASQPVRISGFSISQTPGHRINPMTRDIQDPHQASDQVTNQNVVNPISSQHVSEVSSGKQDQNLSQKGKNKQDKRSENTSSETSSLKQNQGIVEHISDLHLSSLSQIELWKNCGDRITKSRLVTPLRRPEFSGESESSKKNEARARTMKLRANPST